MKHHQQKHDSNFTAIVRWSRSGDKFVAMATHLPWVDGSRWYIIFAANSTPQFHIATEWAGL